MRGDGSVRSACRPVSSTAWLCGSGRRTSASVVSAGPNRFVCDPTTRPRYVYWHMLEHEDNELMQASLCNP